MRESCWILRTAQDDKLGHGGHRLPIQLGTAWRQAPALQKDDRKKGAACAAPWERGTNRVSELDDAVGELLAEAL